MNSSSVLKISSMPLISALKPSKRPKHLWYSWQQIEGSSVDFADYQIGDSLKASPKVVGSFKRGHSDPVA
jgi:hypothetical protein